MNAKNNAVDSDKHVKKIQESAVDSFYAKAEKIYPREALGRGRSAETHEAG